MKHTIILILSILALILFACEENSTLAPENDLLVVHAYLYAGEPVTDIQLTTTLPLGSEEEKAPPVNNAIVSLIKEGQRYSLVPSPGDSGYYHYEGSDLSVETNNEFEIQVEYNGEILSGKTVVPLPPENVSISANQLVIPEEFYPGESGDSMSLTINWKEDASSLFYVVIKCIEENPVEITTSFGPMTGDQIDRLFVFPPTNNNEFKISRFQLSYYGQYVAKVYRVNQEYADLYESREQDSRDLNEPLTNIKNGLGIFSAFASQTVTFTVVSD